MSIKGGCSVSNIALNEEMQVEQDTAKNGIGILTFYIESQIYGIEIPYITDIIEIQPITFVPKLPSYIEGVFNLRGKVVPLINVRDRFGKEKIEYDERTCIIVVELQEMSVGLVVDRVCEVANFSANEITPPPDYKSVNSNRFIKSIVKSGDEVKLILDCQKLILE